MKIEFLYFDGCPNHVRALSHLKESLDELRVDTDIEVIEIKDNSEAVEKQFLGSPSIRINGKDIEIDENESTEYSMRCRRYRYGQNILGYPPKAMILKALKSQKAVSKEK